MPANQADDDPIREEAIDWLMKVEAAPEDPAVRAGLAAWRARSAAHEAAYRRVARMWRLAGDLPAEALAARHPRVRRPLALGGLAAALAACVLFVLAPTVLLHLRADHVSGVGETRALPLADGSRLHLDTESAVTVRFTPARREVGLLAGRAFFEVADDAGRPFVVDAGGLRVTVTGTAFAVGAVGDTVSLAVRSGTVTARADGAAADAVRLRAGDRLTLARETGAVTRSQIRPSDVAAWREGQLVVDGMPLSAVADEIGRYHRGLILIAGGDLDRRPVTGIFSLRDPVAALDAAAGAHGARVTAVSPYLLVVTPR